MDFCEKLRVQLTKTTQQFEFDLNNVLTFVIENCNKNEVINDITHFLFQKDIINRTSNMELFKYLLNAYSTVGNIEEDDEFGKYLNKTRIFLNKNKSLHLYTKQKIILVATLSAFFDIKADVIGGRKRISKSFKNSRIRRKSHRRRCRTVKSRRRRRSVKRRRL